ncbi:MAG: hypothetical protein HRT87_05055 [Legionellales bacterium]|nr:hypothetical protein [Legionellales bacterium]
MGEVIDFSAAKERNFDKVLKNSLHEDISYLISTCYSTRRKLRLEEDKLDKLLAGCNNNNCTLMSKVESIDAYQRIIEYAKYLKNVHESFELLLQKTNEEGRKLFFRLADDELYDFRKREEFVAIDLKLSQEEIAWEHRVLKEEEGYFDELKSKFISSSKDK